MTTSELMEDLEKKGLSPSIVDGDLVVKGDKHLLSAELIAQLRGHKQSLLKLLQEDERGISADDCRPDSHIQALVELKQAEIDQIAGTVLGGEDNLQDIYPLTPLQEGILFHHLMGGEGDPYLVVREFSFDSRLILENYLKAFQAVTDRHDILRTSFHWEGLSTPVQAVSRRVRLHAKELELDAAHGAVAEQLWNRFDPRRFAIDVRQAPLLHLYFAYDAENGRWLMLQLLHHLVGDHTTMDAMAAEIQLLLLGRADELPAPVPFRNLVTQTRFGVPQEEHDAFFRQMLGDIDEPTAPFGLLDVHGDGSDIEAATLTLDANLCRRLRANARKLRVSPASLCHLAWAEVLAKASGHQDVVFGTVLFGRMQGSADHGRLIGLSLNTLPIRVSVGNESVEASVRRVHRLLVELLRHEHASLVLVQRCSAIPAPKPLFSALFNYLHAQDDAGTVHLSEGIRELREEQRTNYPLMLSVMDRGESFSLEAQAPASVGPWRICGFMGTALESLVEALETAPGSPVSTLEVVPESERRLILHDWNQTQASCPAHALLHDLFEAQAQKTPDQIATVFEGQKLTYAELDSRANRLAHRLAGVGVGPDVLVGVCLERSLEMVVAVLGILKAGGAYVPLDPAFPQMRLSQMVEDSRMRVLVTHRGLEQQLQILPPEIVRLDEASAESANSPADCSLLPRAHSESPAYVLYTSGSTGRPKGVEIAHAAIVNFLLSMQREPGFGPTDTLLAVTTLSFDIAGLELYLPLITGGRVVIASRDVIHDPLRLMQQMSECGCTVMQATPATWRALIDAGWQGSPGLKVLCGGEAMPRDLAEDLLARCAELWNMYGPTETTVWSTVHKVHSGAGTVAIGKPIANTQLYILDAQRYPAPVGVSGELYIAGDGLARGYLHREELTRERFVPNPFVAGARMYRTGDMARWLPDGTVECQGRVDNQVKIRGFRIELGEIEACLAEYPGIQNVAVIAREDTPGDKRLAAYYSSSLTEDKAPGAEQLRRHLAATLPDYMLPAAFVRLQRLPLTPNGKLDRNALPAPDADAFSSHGYQPPHGALEEKLAQIWAEVLKIERVGRHDNFFELGGHSLLALQLVLRMQKIISGEALPLRSLLEAPTLERFALWLKNSHERSQRILVQMQKGDPANPPLFCVCAPASTALGMYPLVTALNKELPFYSIQNKGLDGSTPFPTIEDAACFYLDEIRKVQPHGPYRLGGYCIGGIVAFEMARLLEQSGEHVSALFLVDANNPAYLRFIPTREALSSLLTYSLRRMAFHLRKIRPLHSGDLASYVRGRLNAIYYHGRRFLGKGSFGPLHPKAAKPEHVSIDRLDLVVKELERHGWVAKSRFIPRTICADTTIFRAKEHPDDPYYDEFLGWKPVVRGAIHSIEIEASHDTIVHDPAVQTIAATINSMFGMK